MFMFSWCSGVVCGCSMKLSRVLLWIWVSLLNLVGGVLC